MIYKGYTGKVRRDTVIRLRLEATVRGEKLERFYVPDPPNNDPELPGHMLKCVFASKPRSKV